MNHILLSQLIHQDFDVRIVSVHECDYRTPTVHDDYRINGRTHNCIGLIASGRRRYLFQDQEFTQNEGDIVFVPDACNYYTTPISDEGVLCRGISILFDILNTDGKVIQIHHDIYREWDDVNPQCTKLIQSLIGCKDKHAYSILRVKSLLYRLLYIMIAHVEDTTPEYKIIEPSIEYIVQHYKENVPCSVYARECTLSESYFRKKFAECTGMSPIEYRNLVRFDIARKLYQQSRSIDMVAEAVGFCNASYFSKLYKKYRGVSIKNDIDVI